MAQILRTVDEYRQTAAVVRFHFHVDEVLHIIVEDRGASREPIANTAKVLKVKASADFVVDGLFRLEIRIWDDH